MECGVLPGYRFEPVGKLRVRPLAVKLRSGQAASPAM